jgi:5'-nucleotidase
MLSRRKFISQSLLTSGSLVLSSSIANAASLFDSPAKLTILHTNDMHSRIDPFPMDGSRNQGLGGVARRAELVRQIRSREEHVLLFDAGDIFQGTPYFNIYKGEPEIKAMSAMGYDAATIGNHDFDAGLENLSYQVQKHASFPMIISNYDFSGTPMENHHHPYKIINKGRLKIGVFGLGIELQGLVPESLYGNTKYLDPVRRANEVAAELKKKNCDMIICLSHLGYKYDSEPNRMSDRILARETSDIDLIIGGHTHSFMTEPEVIKSKSGNEVIINQVGWAGMQLGRLDFSFEKTKGKKLISSRPITVSKKSDI